MYTYKPPRKDRSHIIVPLILILACFSSIAASNIGSSIIPPSVMQGVAVVCVSVAIMLISRYSLAQFVYDANDETRVLSVHKIMGKKSTLVAAIDYADMIGTDKKKKGFSLKKKYNKAYKIHNFCNNMFTDHAYYIVCSIEGQDIAVIIEADKTLLTLISTKTKNSEKKEEE